MRKVALYFSILCAVWALCWLFLSLYKIFLIWYNLTGDQTSFRSSLTMASRAFPISSPHRLNISFYTFNYLIYLNFSLVHGEKYWSTFSLLQVESQFSYHHALKTLSVFQCKFLAPLLKIKSRRLAPIFYPAPLIHMSDFVQYHCMFITERV